MNAKHILLLLTALLLTATATLLIACDRSEDDITLSGPDNTGNGSNGNADALCIVTAKQPFSDETGTRAVTDFGGTYSTSFVSGDEIGVIAVKGGAVLADCNNVKLTYNAVDSKWEGGPVYFKDGATYIAYSPYRAVMNGKMSVQEIYDAFTVSTNQYWEEYFLENDLMIADNGTVNKTAKTLSFAFEHKLALLEISRSYYGRTTDGWTYPFKNINITSVTIGSITDIYPFTDETDYSTPYRYYVKPVADVQISIKYYYEVPGGLGGGYALSSLTWNASGGQTFVGGQHRKIIPSRTRDLEVGDYYYSDGSIAPTRTIKSCGVAGDTNCPGKDLGCIGVVFATPSNAIGDVIGNYIGTGLTGNIHGYVVALDDANEGATAEWGIGVVNTSTDKIDYVGYSNTKKIQAVGGYSGASYPACWHATNYKVGAPGNTSGWYLPSVGQLQAIYLNLVKNKGTVFSHVGGTEYKGSWYFSSSEDSTNSNLIWALGFAGGGMSSGNKLTKSCIRSCFTF